MYPVRRYVLLRLDEKLANNLLLLNRNKNSQAQNFDFATKKEKYFSPAAGVTGFALTTLVLSEPAWTPEIVEQRQKNLVELLAEEWSL